MTPQIKLTSWELHRLRSATILLDEWDGRLTLDELPDLSGMDKHRVKELMDLAAEEGSGIEAIDNKSWRLNTGIFIV